VTVTRGDAPDVIANARLTGSERTDPFGDDVVDVHLADGLVVDIAPAGALPRRGTVVDAEGGRVIPGLWDHHVHVVQWALSAQRVPLGGATSAAHAASLIAGASALADGRRVGSGFRDAFWPDVPELTVLDAATGDIPTYLINADVHSVWLNSAALRREGIEPDGVGLLREEPAFEISRRHTAVDVSVSDPLVARMAQDAAARGVTGLVDFDMAWSAEAWPRRVQAGFASHRVEFAMYPFDLERAIAAGLRTGELQEGQDVPEGGRGLIRVGPLKVITDGSLGTRTAACSHSYPGDPSNFGVLTVPPDELVALLTRATGAGLAVAVHAIGDRAITSALDAFTTTGAVGSIEHVQLVRHSDLARFARLGVVASVQPQHAVDDRDLVDRLWPEQTAIGYPLASLLAAGAELRFGSDAPVSELDPWQGIAAAVSRTDDDRAPWHPEESISIDQALEASVRSALRPGEPADIVVCDADPRAASGEGLRSMPVRSTLLAGRVTHSA